MGLAAGSSMSASIAIIQPFEVLIIGGAALGAFLQSNPGSTFMVVLKKAPKMFSNR
ncbi:motility-associated protein, partial [Pseudomonas aeruginosa]